MWSLYDDLYPDAKCVPTVSCFGHAAASCCNCKLRKFYVDILTAIIRTSNAKEQVFAEAIL
ncbi:hypothetical protein E2562_032781 [Oryza meyeriana var. granulata]|uniref:Uncharacterized protein n=1 Tax=Oryza meyeriana var. granulata TaxID=110450 RepID=A0A6G1F0U7_9ORYZ|nr:hypothetical protein E2562_032781 [Oryza meyeriana var. granulata]